MQKPDISTQVSDPRLIGTEGHSSWVQGRNCVYLDSTTENYRVSVKTPTGWKYYGHFYDLATASYVANVAILAEACEGTYELNKGIGAKNRQELAQWRRQGQHSALEKCAREKYKKVQDALEAMRAEERRLHKEALENAERARAEIAARQQERDAKEAALIAQAPTAILLDLLSRDISGEQNRKIRAELEKRRSRRGAT